MAYYFDWTGFEEDKLRKCNSEIGSFEDMIYGFVYLTCGEKKYLIDVHYEYYNAKDCRFDLEVYEQLPNGHHGKWIDSIKTIRSATDYRRFCRRAENAIIELLRRETDVN